MLLAAIHGRMRLVVLDETGRPVQATSAARCFTGRMRDMLLLLATHCTHAGCLVPASQCQGARGANPNAAATGGTVVIANRPSRIRRRGRRDRDML